MVSTSLDEIGLKYATDKASMHHDYLHFYESFFSSLRNLPLTILEIGISSGASLKTWEEYFPHAKIIGADIVASSKRFEQGRVVVELLDQSNVEELTRMAIKYGPFDIVVEDGSHVWEHQITTLRTLFPFVKNNGLYIIEDLQTNYGPMEQDYRGVSSLSCVEYLKKWLDLRVGDDQIQIENIEDAFLRTYGRAAQFLTFYRRACLIRKQFESTVREPDEGSSIVVLDHETVTTEIFAHISDRGDILSTSGFLNPTASDYPFQGLSLSAGDQVLEYRVRWSDQTWSDWSQESEFIGTRGESKLLTGVTVRLREHVSKQFSLRTIGRFAISGEVVIVLNGQDCTAVSGSALCGIQIDLQKLS